MGIFPLSRRSNRNNPRWFIMVSLEGLLWYIFPVERLVGFFLVKLFFPAKKTQDDSREVVGGGVRILTRQTVSYLGFIPTDGQTTVPFFYSGRNLINKGTRQKT